VKLPVIGRVASGSVAYGLCGGMCFAALDYYHAGRSVPGESDVDLIVPEVQNYLRRRQLDSLSLPVVARVIRWMMLDDRDVGRLTVTQQFPKLRARLERDDPAVLLLVRARGMEDPTRNHQVIAVGYQLDDTAGYLTIYVYDPNHPGMEPTISMTISQPDRGIHAEQSTGEELRAFFVNDYRPRVAP
jgi:hypothetical protein